MNHADEVVVIAGHQLGVPLFPPPIEYGDGGTNVDIALLEYRSARSGVRRLFVHSTGNESLNVYVLYVLPGTDGRIE